MLQWQCHACMRYVWLCMHVCDISCINGCVMHVCDMYGCVCMYVIYHTSVAVSCMYVICMAASCMYVIRHASMAVPCLYVTCKSRGCTVAAVGKLQVHQVQLQTYRHTSYIFLCEPNPAPAAALRIHMHSQTHQAVHQQQTQLQAC